MQANEMARNRALYSQDAESAALGGIMRRMQELDRSIAYTVSEEDFYFEPHKMLYRALRSLADRQEIPDMLTIDEEIHRLFPKIADNAMNTIIELVGQFHTKANVNVYIEMVKEAALRRRLITLSDKLTNSAMNGSEDISVILDDARSQLREMASIKATWASMMDVMLSTIDELEKRQKGVIRGIGSGVSGIDRATGGFFPGELAVIGARPSVGKSAFGLQIAVDAAIRGHRVCFVSLEMVDSQFGQRLLSNATNVDGMKMRSAKLSDQDWISISDASNQYSALPISFSFGTKTIEDLKNDIQHKVDTGDCDIVVIDYLQLLRTRRKFEAEYERVGYISHMLKQMTTDLRIPVVALAQAKRQNNGGRARCPTLEDLRSSGDIEQDADTVIFLHRPDDSADPAIDERDRQYFAGLQDKGFQYIAFSVAKQRQGQTGVIGAVFDPAHMRYLSMDRVREE